MTRQLDFRELAAELEGRSADPWGYIAMTLAQAYQVYGGTSVGKPAWVPFLGPLARSSGANPDTVYGVTLIDPTATYRIVGTKGSTLFSDVLAQAGLGGLGAKHGPTVASVDLTDIETDEDGNFELLVGPEVAPHSVGLRVDERADHLWLRQVSYDWATTVDGRVGIERVEPGEGPDPIRPEQLQGFVERYIRLWNGHIDGIRKRGLVNALELEQLPDTTGTVQQSYYQGMFALDSDEALIIQFAAPDDCRYWSIQVTDESFVTPDWRYHQCSINGAQATRSASGNVVIVLSPTNPGCANWLDTGGLRQGSILGRWNRSSQHPLPSIELAKIADVQGTFETVTSASDAVRLSRSIASQMRRAC